MTTPRRNRVGGTEEACGFKDALRSVDAVKAVILGISPDSVKSEAKFKAKYELPYTLLADEEKVVLQAYDVWKEKSMYGKKYMGVERTTFVIDPAGQIATVFTKVKPAGHAADVIAANGQGGLGGTPVWRDAGRLAD